MTHNNNNIFLFKTLNNRYSYQGKFAAMWTFSISLFYIKSKGPFCSIDNAILVLYNVYERIYMDL